MPLQFVQSFEDILWVLVLIGVMINIHEAGHYFVARYFDVKVEAFSFGFGVDFEVESYLRYRGLQFVGRFDANSYLYITKAMDYFDLAAGFPSLAASLERARCRFLVISFTSDWLYPSYQSLEIVNALRGRNHDVTYCELTSNYGHDAFLVDIAEQSAIVRGFLARCEREAEEAA